jgi:hypothetical protein
MKLRFMSAAVLVLAGAFIVSAQNSSATATGKLSGLVVDPDGSVIPNAKVVVETSTFRREVVAGETGRYEIELPTGNYLVTAVRGDFHPTIVKGVVIASNALTTLDVTLKGIQVFEELVPLEPLRTEPPVLNPTIQLRKILRKP